MDQVVMSLRVKTTEREESHGCRADHTLFLKVQVPSRQISLMGLILAMGHVV